MKNIKLILAGFCMLISAAAFAGNGSVGWTGSEDINVTGPETFVQSCLAHLKGAQPEAKECYYRDARRYLLSSYRNYKGSQGWMEIACSNVLGGGIYDHTGFNSSCK